MFFIMALMLVPKINFLNFLMPLDNSEKWIKFIFALLTAYIVLLVLSFLWDYLKQYSKCKPKHVFRMMGEYGEYINLYYSEDINEYSMKTVDLYKYGITRDVVNKLCENNIIEKYETSWYGDIEYRLTKKARKKFTRIRKIVIFIDSKIINKCKTKKDSQEQKEKLEQCRFNT